jgi:hypothetical protein
VLALLDSPQQRYEASRWATAQGQGEETMNTQAVTCRELDAWLAETGAESVVVHGFCHASAEQLVFYWGGTIAVRCRTCNAHVVNIAVTTKTHEEITAMLMVGVPGDEAVRLKPSCHMKSGLYLTYSDGKIGAACGKCKALITTLDIRKSAEESTAP